MSPENESQKIRYSSFLFMHLRIPEAQVQKKVPILTHSGYDDNILDANLNKLPLCKINNLYKKAPLIHIIEKNGINSTLLSQTASPIQRMSVHGLY